MKKWTALALSLLLLLSLSACGREEAEEPVSGNEYGLWFAVDPDSDRTDYSAIARESRLWAREPTAEELVRALLSGPESSGLYAPFPSGVSVLSVTLEEGEQAVRVDLSEQYGGLAGFELTVADYCMTLTLCQLPQVKTVKVTVEGKSIPYRDRQELQAGDVLLSGIAEEPGTFLAALYFPDRAGGLAVEYRQVTRADGGEPAEIAMAELLRGPSDPDECLSLPEGTQVFSLSVEDGVCRADLSREFVTNAPAEEEQAGLTLYAMVNTLCALAGVSQVQLLIVGETIDSYGGVSVSAPLSANFDLAAN